MSQAPNFNDLTPAETELLAILAEECGEVVQAVGKILRHGFSRCHPDGVDSNRETLVREVGDVQAAIQMLCDAKCLSPVDIAAHRARKLHRVAMYMHHRTSALQGDENTP